MTLAAVTLSATTHAPAQQPAAALQPAAASPDYVSGVPQSPSKAWTIAAGGRIYDNWWEALGRKKPKDQNPAYPALGKRTGPTTWRCVECHGWDYKGRSGISGQKGPMADRFTGVKGVLAASPRTATALTKMLRAAPHGYTPDMIKDEEIARLAAFLGGGLHDTDRFINRRTKAVKGNPVRGAGLYQGTCAACHGFDGKTLNWGTKEEPSYVGTEARSLPWEVAHKIRNAHPGSNMINLRAFPMQDTIDILAYTQTLPEK